MKNQAYFWSILILKIMIIAVMIFNFGCGAGPGQFSSKQEIDRVKEQIFKDLRESVELAEAKNMVVLSPNNYKRANECYQKALIEYEKGERLSKIQEQVDQAMTYLDAGFELIRLSNVVLADIIDLRKQIVIREIPQSLQKDFRKAEEKFIEAVVKVEEGDIKKAKSIAIKAERKYVKILPMTFEKEIPVQPYTTTEIDGVLYAGNKNTILNIDVLHDKSYKVDLTENLPVISDPNEIKIPDSKDFKSVYFYKTSNAKDGYLLHIDINFYGTYQDWFSAYISTDGDKEAELILNCLNRNYFEVITEGNYKRLYQGIPTTTFTQYSVDIPLEKIFKGIFKIELWFKFVLEPYNPDRLPDKGSLTLSLPSCLCFHSFPSHSDFNADGKDDIITFTRWSNGKVYVTTSTGSQFKNNASVWHDNFCLNNGIPAIGDFNGDGGDDIVSFNRKGIVTVALSTGSKFQSKGKIWNYAFCYGKDIPMVGDFNGDGRDDIASFNRNGYVCVALSKCTKSNGHWNWKFASTGFCWHTHFCYRDDLPAIGDFNGDGKDDILTYNRRTGKVAIALSNGSTFQGTGGWNWKYNVIAGERIKVGDFNGDGKDDLVLFARGYKKGVTLGVYVVLSKGNGFHQAVSQWHPVFCDGNKVPVIGDFNGDGKDDIAFFVRSAESGSNKGDVCVALSTGSKFQSSTKPWHNYFCVDKEVPTTHAAVIPTLYPMSTPFHNKFNQLKGEYSVLGNPISDSRSYNWKGSNFEYEVQDFEYGSMYQTSYFNNVRVFAVTHIIRNYWKKYYGGETTVAFNGIGFPVSDFKDITADPVMQQAAIALGLSPLSEGEYCHFWDGTIFCVQGQMKVIRNLPLSLSNMRERIVAVAQYENALNVLQPPWCGDHRGPRIDRITSEIHGEIDACLWCTEFVGYVYSKANWNIPKGKFKNTNGAKDWFKDNNAWMSRNTASPKPGDYVRILWKDNGKKKKHSALVEKVDAKGVLWTIEGNCGDQVCRKSYPNWKNDTTIDGFGDIQKAGCVDYYYKVVSK